MSAMRETAHGFSMNTQDNGAAVAVAGAGLSAVASAKADDPGSANGATETAAGGSGYKFPNSKKVYIAGTLRADVRVPFREISLAPTKSMNGVIEVNEAVRVYDTSGPWGDPNVTLDPLQGLPPLRRDWILKRGDVDEIEGRVVRPIDDGYLSETHAAHASRKGSTPNSDKSRAGADRPTFNGAGAPSSRKPLRGSAGCPVTQLYYARQGIVTPEMEFIAIRENGHANPSSVAADGSAPRTADRGAAANGSGYNRNDLRQQHPG